MNDSQQLLGSSGDVMIDFGADDQKKKIKHPVAVTFHFLFKVVAFLCYLLGGILFQEQFVLNFIVIVILLSLDFWTVKNVTGRLMVGLRWWNQVDESGKSQWIFESRQGEQRKLIATTEARLFWAAMVVAELIWSVYLLATLILFNFKWLVVVLFALGMNSANLYGYARCKIGSAKSLRDQASSFFSRQLFKSALSMASRGTPSQPTPSTRT